MSANEWGLPAALSVIVIAPLRVPAAEGVKAIVMLHPEAALTVPTQLSVSVKSPLDCMLVTIRLALPKSAICTWAVLDVPTGVTPGRESVPGRPTAGALMFSIFIRNPSVKRALLF